MAAPSAIPHDVHTPWGIPHDPNVPVGSGSVQQRRDRARGQFVQAIGDPARTVPLDYRHRGVVERSDKADWRPMRKARTIELCLSAKGMVARGSLAASIVRCHTRVISSTISVTCRSR
jgi:hypothetical protein